MIYIIVMMILQAVDLIPPFSWTGVLTIIAIPVISYLFSRNQKDQDEKIERLENGLEALKSTTSTSNANMVDRLNKVNMEILKQINEISVEIAKFKKN